MYIERKAGAITGAGRIGRVTFDKTGRTIWYAGKTFRRIVGGDFKSNYVQEETAVHYWISGCKRDGDDRVYGSSLPVPIDEDVGLEYWRDIRKQPERSKEATT